MTIVKKLGQLLVAASLAWATPGFASQTIDRVVAVVNDDIILDSELEQFAAQGYRGPDPDSPEGHKAWEEARKKALDGMIDSKLIQQEAVELKLTVTNDEVDRAVEQVKTQNHLEDAQFAEALKAQGFTMDAYRKTLKKQILELKVVSQAVRSRISVSDDEVRSYYKQNQKSLGGSDAQVRLRQVLIALPAKATEDEIDKKKRIAIKVVELAREGHKFDDLAKQFSEDEGTKGNGGDLGFVGKGTLVDELDDAVQAMEPGDVRGPIRTERGWVVLQLVERKQGDLKAFDEIKEQLRRQLYDEQVEKSQQSWLKELRKHAHVDVHLNQDK